MNETANQEIKHMLSSISLPDIVGIIASEPCPYRQEGLILALQDCWRELENAFDERAVYQINDQWVYKWPTMQDTIHSLLQRARNAQTKPKPTNPPTTNLPTTPQTPTTMPKKSTVNITNHFYGNIGQHIDHIDTQHVSFDKDMNMQIAKVNHQHLTPTPAPSAPAPTRDLEKFRSLLTVPYLNRKREYEAMIELLTQDHWNKKDRARMALALYQSGNVALKREHITTFRQWWQICCELLGWEGANACYRIAELTENNLSKQILAYM